MRSLADKFFFFSAGMLNLTESIPEMYSSKKNITWQHHPPNE
jgi:hypothetical protein